MSFEEARVIFIVYTCSIVPLLLVLFYKEIFPKWVPTFYLGAFLTCALGWEIWMTFGLVDGDPVSLRRSEVLNTWLPQNINWILNSLGDAGAVCLGGLWLMWRYAGKDTKVFNSWDWGAFSVLMIWCVGQNILVEMFLYHDQLSVGKPLSWAPLIPSGPYFNPLLFEFNDRTVMLQTQIPWLILPPFLYIAVIKLSNKRTI
jgi:hypothetical protein